MARSKANATILEYLMFTRKHAGYQADIFASTSAHPTHQRLYQLAMHPDVDRLRQSVAQNILTGTEAAWRTRLAPDEQGRVANLFILDYDIAQNCGRWTDAFHLKKKLGPDYDLDFDLNQLPRIPHADGIGAFCLQPFDRFVSTCQEDFEPFEDNDLFWRLAKLMVATSHLIAHLAFQSLEDNGAFRDRGLNKPTYFATQEHGESHAIVVYAVG